MDDVPEFFDVEPKSRWTPRATASVIFFAWAWWSSR
jgi:hypothetical protein